MKTTIVLNILLTLSGYAFSQIPIRDIHITNQQERMVFKQWDRRKFTPTKGWLGLNPLYWLTWGLHPDYPKKDLRPLGPLGPQTSRFALVTAMQNIINSYKLHSDTLRNTAVSEAVNYSGIVSDTDPLWILYYRFEFKPLLEFRNRDQLNGVPNNEKSYLIQNGAYEWFMEESAILEERLSAARNTTLDRGSRIIAYHRLLAEYRKLYSTWDTKKRNAKQFLTLTKVTAGIRNKGEPIARNYNRTDQQIAFDILSKSKL